MIYIAQKSDDGVRLGLKQIARETDSPVAFTAKILQQLSRAGLLQSLKGPTGGFLLARPAEQIMLVEIVSAIDGDAIFSGCGLGLKECNALHPCPLHDKFKVVRDELSQMLRTTSLKETSASVSLGHSYLKI